MTSSMIEGFLAIAGLFAALGTMVWSLLVNDSVGAKQVAGEKRAVVNRAA